MQQRHREDEGAVEPVGHVDVAHLADADGAEEDDGVGDPGDGDQDVDRPFEFGVFLALRVTQGQRDRRGDDHRLPGPEVERRQLVHEQRHLAGALHHVIAGAHERAAAEGEDHRVGVQRPQAPVTEPGDAEVQFRPRELRGDEEADQHADHAPHHRHQREQADDAVVVDGCGLGFWVHVDTFDWKPRVSRGIGRAALSQVNRRAESARLRLPHGPRQRREDRQCQRHRQRDEEKEDVHRFPMTK